MIKPKEKVYIYIKMAQFIQVNGLQINSMVMVNKNGLMVLSIKEISNLGLNKEMVRLFGLILVNIRESFIIIILNFSLLLLYFLC